LLESVYNPAASLASARWPFFRLSPTPDSPGPPARRCAYRRVLFFVCTELGDVPFVHKITPAASGWGKANAALQEDDLGARPVIQRADACTLGGDAPDLFVRYCTRRSTSAHRPSPPTHTMFSPTCCLSCSKSITPGHPTPSLVVAALAIGVGLSASLASAAAAG
jgi:hypothetical protein